MKRVGDDFTEHVAAKQVFDNGEGRGQGGCHAQRRADGEDTCEEQLGKGLDCEAEQGIEEGPSDDLAEAEHVLPCVGVAVRECEPAGAVGFERCGGGGQERVEEEEG